MLTQVCRTHSLDFVAIPLIGGMREAPPQHPPTTVAQDFRNGRLAYLCVRNAELRSTIALELRSEGYQVIEAEDAEDLLLYSGFAQVVFSDSLHVISRARRLVSDKHTSLCAVMMRDDPYCEVDAFMMGATDVVRRA